MINRFTAEHQSLWSAHKAKRAVVAGAGVAAPEPSATRDDGVWRAQVLADHQNLRSQYPDHQERHKHIPGTLEKYRRYLLDWMDAGKTGQNDVLVRCCIWAADCGQWGWAIQLADYGAGQISGMARDLRTFVADSVLQADGIPGEKAKVLAKLQSKLWCVNPILFAKYLRWYAKYEKTRNPAAALRYAQEATVLDPTIGLKGLIEELSQCVPSSSGASVESLPPQAAGDAAGEAGFLVSPADDPSADPGAPVFLTDT